MRYIRLLFLFGSFIFLMCNASLAQNKVISGTITDNNNAPLAGASVIVKGTPVSTSTDKNGIFSLSVSSSINVILTISYIGYESFDYPLGSDLKVSVALNPAGNKMGEVVVVGYGSKRKQSLTGSVSTVSAKDFDNTPTGNISDMLAGRLPGVSVISPTGMPGVTSSILIRGRGTWNNVGATYVIDGIIRDQFAMDGLDPNEIETISVLKDAASTAVYGARAANGVVLITTKRGKSGKPVINFKTITGIQKPVNLPEQLNAYDNAVLQNNAYITQGNVPGSPIFYSQDELDYFKTINYNWLDYAWKTPVSAQHNLSINGGSENIKYFASLGYYDAKGSFDNISFKRYNFRTNVDAKITDRLSLSLNIDGNIRKDHKFYWYGEGGSMQNWYQTLLYMSPNVPPYINDKPVGNFTPYHPIEVSRNGGYNDQNWSSYNAQAILSYSLPVDGLKFKYVFSTNTIFDYNKTFYKPYTMYQFKTRGGGNHIITDEVDKPMLVAQTAFDFVKEDIDQQSSYQMNAYLTYDKKFGNHEVGALFVYEQAESQQNNFFGQGQNLLTNSIDQVFISSNAAGNRLSDGSASESGRSAYLLRANYNFKNKYLLEGSFRYDGSLLFPKDTRWGFFPGISGGWRISEENFFKDNIRVINSMKIRASYGKVGNDGGIRPFQYQQNYANANGAVFGVGTPGLQPGVYPNTSITWEKSNNYNAGVEISALNNKFTFEFDYFMRHTYDILRSRIRTIPGTFGAQLPDENYAVVDTKGFEIAAGYNNTFGKVDFYTRVNMGFANNKVVQIDVAPNTPDYLSPIGKPINLMMGYTSTGILRTPADVSKLPQGYNIFGLTPVPGMLNYADLYGPAGSGPDGIVNENDVTAISDRVDPRINYGISVGAKWKNFSLDLFFQGLLGVDKMVDWRHNLVLGNNYSFWKDHWTPDNPNAAFPRVHGYGDPNVTAPSTFWVKNASFMRLKNLNLSYSIPQMIIEKAGLKSVAIFFTGTNLFTLDKLKLMDPETNSISAYPNMKTLSFGLNITL